MMALALVNSLAQCAENRTELSHDSKNLADWVVDSGDNQGLPFIIVDKREAMVFMFLPDGGFYKASPALIGTTIGDDISPGVGQKKLSEVGIEERTTPAGRFESQLGTSPNKSELLWIDYESGVSMHPVVTSNASEHRLERLSGTKISARRITYGCVNVSSHFYTEAVHPTFKNTSGIVYILPEVHSIKMVFGAEAGRFSQRK
jgi:hypothetical protein